MLKKLKRITAKYIAGIINFIIEILDNLRDFILALMGELDLRESLIY